MALIKYNHESMMKAMEPGLSPIVANAFRDKLEKKVNGIIEEVHAELADELPKIVKTQLKTVLSPEFDGVNVNVQINLND